MSLPHSKPELRFADGAAITAFESFELRERFSDPLDSFSCTLVPAAQHRKDYRERLQKGELISLLVDGKPQCAAMIKTVTKTISPDGGYRFDIDAVSPLDILYESSIDPKVGSKYLEADAPVLRFVADIVRPFGFEEVYDQGDVAMIKAKTGVNPKSPETAAANAKQAKCSMDSNESVYGFINRVLSRLGCILRCDPSTALLYITAPHYEGKPLYTVKQSGPGRGPVGDRLFGQISIVDSNGQQYSECTVIGEPGDERGETRSNLPKARAVTADINAQRPPFRSSGPFPYKPAYFKDKNVGSKVRAQCVAKHVLGRRAESAFQVKGRVHGLVSRDGIPWTVDTLGRVYVEADELDEVMWLSERTMRQDASAGQYTDLVWIPKGNLFLGDIATS